MIDGLPERIKRRIVMEHDCWNWVGAVNNNGYGSASWNGKPQGMHRITYEAVHGPIPEGMEIDHICRNRRCCNPAHLEVVTHQENNRRRGADVTQCPRGHEYTPENTRIMSRGGRACRECLRMHAKKYRARQRANINAR